MSMYRNYLLKNGFWAEKLANKKVYLKHDNNIGGIYAIIQESPIKGVKIIISKKEYFFNNFNKLDEFLTNLQTNQTEFMKILRRKLMSAKLRKITL